MSYISSLIDGNFDGAGVWALVDTTSRLDSESNRTTVPTTPTDSTSWTYASSPPTVDGMAIKVSRRLGSTGTITITLRNTTDNVDVVSVIANITDLGGAVSSVTGVSSGGASWYFFNFGSSQVLATGKNYTCRLSTSTANQLEVYVTSGNNWTRFIRTTTAQGPVATDSVHIVGEIQQLLATTNDLTNVNWTKGTNTTVTATTLVVATRVGTYATQGFSAITGQTYYFRVLARDLGGWAK